MTGVQKRCDAARTRAGSALRFIAAGQRSSNLSASAKHEAFHSSITAHALGTGGAGERFELAARRCRVKKCYKVTREGCKATT
jgi:hypothetical protein